MVSPSKNNEQEARTPVQSLTGTDRAQEERNALTQPGDAVNFRPDGTTGAAPVLTNVEEAGVENLLDAIEAVATDDEGEVDQEVEDDSDDGDPAGDLDALPGLEDGEFSGLVKLIRY
jgi:hypothetical protein